MQTITAQLDTKFRDAIKRAFNIDADPILVPSANEKFGDYQANAAMSLAKTLSEKTGQKTNPRQVAEQIKSNLELDDIASEVSIAGPGFINVRLSPAWLAKQLQSIAKDDRLGVEPTKQPQTVIVDYSGPNIAKELHVGHLRSTIIGDAIVRILDFQGQNVIRQNHIGDWGTQFGMLIAFGLQSGLFRFEENTTRPWTSPTGELVDRPATVARALFIRDLEGFYRESKQRFDADHEFQEEARRTVVRLQQGAEPERIFWSHIVDETRAHYQGVYERLGVLLTEADERGESFYNSMLQTVVADLKKSGIAVESEGATVIPVEGYENPLIIEKTGGGYLYGTTDLAAIRYRVNELHADRVIYLVDARQSQHFAQVFATARKAGWAREHISLEHAAFGTMLGDDGKPFKTRTGGVVKLADLLDEAEERALKLVTEKSPELPEEQRKAIAHSVGVGGIKYFDLSKDRVSDYVFSFDKMLAMDGNTAPYLQYVYARIRSIFRKAEALGVSTKHAGIHLESPHEVALAKHILRLGEIIEIVSRELKPHHLTTYLYDLATRFSGFYENCPVIQAEEPTRSSRLALSDLTARTMAKGLDLLGIEHPEQM